MNSGRNCVATSFYYILIERRYGLGGVERNSFPLFRPQLVKSFADRLDFQGRILDSFELDWEDGFELYYGTNTHSRGKPDREDFGRSSLPDAREAPNSRVEWGCDTSIRRFQVLRRNFFFDQARVLWRLTNWLSPPPKRFGIEDVYAAGEPCLQI